MLMVHMCTKSNVHTGLKQTQMSVKSIYDVVYFQTLDNTTSVLTLEGLCAGL